jgi:hypothetical protein
VVETPKTLTLLQTFFATLHQEVKALTLSGLSSLGVDVAVTDRATELKMTLDDYTDLKHITTKLAEIYANTQSPLYKQSEEYIHAKVFAYLPRHLFCYLLLSFVTLSYLYISTRHKDDVHAKIQLHHASK